MNKGPATWNLACPSREPFGGMLLCGAGRETPVSLRLGRPLTAAAMRRVRHMHIQEQFARQTIELARQARIAGNHPFGAVLVVDGMVALTAQNTVFTDRDPTAHAETNLMTQAIRDLSPGQIRRSVLYTSCEPCAMCVGKMYWGGIRSMVYALPAEELAALAGRDFLIPCVELFGRAIEHVRIAGPLLVNEAREVHLGFWSPPAV